MAKTYGVSPALAEALGELLGVETLNDVVCAVIVVNYGAPTRVYVEQVSDATKIVGVVHAIDGSPVEVIREERQ